jgi:hypothetical protein
MDEIDIWRIATTLIEAHGFTSAAFVASHQAKDMRDKGDEEGASVWMRVESAIEELEKTGYERDASRN